MCLGPVQFRKRFDMKTSGQTTEHQPELQLPILHISSRLLVDLPLNRMLNQLTTTVQKELFLDVGLISFDSLNAEVQFLGNLTRASTLADQTEDL